MYISETKIRVRYAETDQMGRVYHGNYAQYFEQARTESIRQLGFTYKEMEAMDVIMPIVEINCKFLRPAHYDDLLTIKVILKEISPDHRIEFLHEVYNEKGKLLTVGNVVLFFINSKTMKKTIMPLVFRDALHLQFENYEKENGFV
ncbi:MAG: thioesterase family protein [Chitinophagaceae bacterium]